MSLFLLFIIFHAPIASHEPVHTMLPVSFTIFDLGFFIWSIAFQEITIIEPDTSDFEQGSSVPLIVFWVKKPQELPMDNSDIQCLLFTLWNLCLPLSLLLFLIHNNIVFGDYKLLEVVYCSSLTSIKLDSVNKFCDAIHRYHCLYVLLFHKSLLS